MKGRTASEKISSFARYAGDIQDKEVHAAARAFIDTVAVTIAGQEEPACRMAREYLLADCGAGMSSFWGSTAQGRAEDAALVNGLAGHILDYDHITLPLRGHPSVVLFPALVSLGETIDATGGQIATAYTVGFEVMVKMAKAVAFCHYAKGWDPTSTLGVVAAAAGCSQLLGLSADQTICALGIAAAHAAGSRRSFGTMTKALQAGHAAADAVRAAKLAAKGFTAPRDALDGAFGYVDLYGHGENLLHRELDTLGEKPLELLSTGFEVKQFPCCYATHCAIQGVQELLAQQPMTVSEIKCVRVTTQREGLSALIHHRPWRGLEGKFSLEYVVAATLLDGTVRLESFTDAAVQQPIAQALLRRVEGFEEDERWPRRAMVEVELRSGERRSARVMCLEGSSQVPLEDADFETKFRDCVASSRSDVDVQGFLEAVWNWRDQPIRSILRCLAQGIAEPRLENRALRTVRDG